MNQEPYKWPPRSQLTFHNGRGKLLLSSTDRLFDLSDNLMLHWPHASRTAYMTIELSNPKGKWAHWDDATLKQVESLIRYDLGFDAYRVRITRLSITNNQPCCEAFRWKLQIQPM